jgi:integrase
LNNGSRGGGGKIMAKKQTLPQGVTVQTRSGVQYYYARLGNKRKYCGRGEQGFEIAIAARAMHIGKRYEKREVAVGLNVSRVQLKTFEDLSKWCLSRPQTKRLKSYQTKSTLAGHLARHIGKKALAEIEDDMLEDYREVRGLEGAAIHSINAEVSLCRAMYNLAVRRRKIPRELKPSEFPFVRGEKAAPPRRVITTEEFERLLEAADDDFADALVRGYETSLRLREIADLRVKDVRLDVPHISGNKLDFLAVTDVKNGKTKTPPVSPELKEVLLRRLKGLAPGDRVFAEAGLPYNTNVVTHRMKKYCTLAGIPYGDKLRNEKGERIGVVLHSLRHTRTTIWVEEGWSDQIIMKATGHNSLEVYQGYIHLDASSVMQLVERHKNDTKSPRIRSASAP